MTICPSIWNEKIWHPAWKKKKNRNLITITRHEFNCRANFMMNPLMWYQETGYHFRMRSEHICFHYVVQITMDCELLISPASLHASFLGPPLPMDWWGFSISGSYHYCCCQQSISCCRDGFIMAWHRSASRLLQCNTDFTTCLFWDSVLDCARCHPTI